MTELKVGMGCTQSYGSDRYPATVVKVHTPRKISFQMDNYQRIDNNGPFTEDQTYSYSPNPDSPVVEARLHKDGRWRTKGGNTIWVGDRNRHCDPHK